MTDENAAPDVPKNSAYLRQTLYLPRSEAKRLKLMALSQDRKVHDIIKEGLDLAMMQYGHEPIDWDV